MLEKILSADRWTGAGAALLPLSEGYVTIYRIKDRTWRLLPESWSCAVVVRNQTALRDLLPYRWR